MDVPERVVRDNPAIARVDINAVCITCPATMVSFCRSIAIANQGILYASLVDALAKVAGVYLDELLATVNQRQIVKFWSHGMTIKCDSMTIHVSNAQILHFEIPGISPNSVWNQVASGDIVHSLANQGDIIAACALTPNSYIVHLDRKRSL